MARNGIGNFGGMLAGVLLGLAPSAGAAVMTTEPSATPTTPTPPLIPAPHAMATTGVGVEDGRVEYPMFGVSVVPPAHWTPVEDVVTGTVQRWQFKEPNRPEPRWVLSLEVKPAEKQSLPEQVARFIRQVGGKPMEHPPELGDAPTQGALVELEQGGKMKLLFAQKDDRVYMLQASSVDEVFPQAAFRELAESLRWTPPIAPSRDPLDDEPRTLVGRVTVRLPEGMRPLATPPGAAPPKPTATWRLFNYRVGATELLLTVTAEPGTGAEVRAAAERRALDVRAQGELKWSAIPGDGTAERTMTQLLPTRGREPSTPPALRRWAVATTHDGKSALLEFAVAPADPRDVPAYEEMTAMIVRAIGGK